MQKHIRVLVLSLIFSGALNIALFATLLLGRLGEKEEAPLSFSRGKVEEIPNLQFLAKMSSLSFRELVAYLTNRSQLEEGYRTRDLALASLVAFHDFSIEGALKGAPLQKREIVLPTGQKMALFPGLSDAEFQSVIRFAYEEKCPFTARGIFQRLREGSEPEKLEELKGAFCATSEFEAVRTLFLRTGASQDKEALLQLLLQGQWDWIEQFAAEQEQILDFSPERRRAFLLGLLRLHSPLAAEMLIKTDASFALRKLTDAGILTLLALLPEKSPELEPFCKALCSSARTDAVWRGALEKLYAFWDKPMPESLDLSKAVEESLGRETAAVKEPVKEAAPAAPIPAAPRRQHVVQEGESLWKIARTYKVKVDDLVSLNGLEKDRLYPGMTLQIPEQ